MGVAERHHPRASSTFRQPCPERTTGPDGPAAGRLAEKSSAASLAGRRHPQAGKRTIATTKNRQTKKNRNLNLWFTVRLRLSRLRLFSFSELIADDCVLR